MTSCERHDLLQVTLDSFFAHVDIQPAKTIILEDSRETLCYVASEGPILWEENEVRLGQIKSCDKLMGMVETEWVFWCEDDWLFKDSNFIEPSYAILAQYPEIVCVGLRGRAWNHPLRDYTEWPFLVAEPSWQGGWGGFAFNPGLRRKSDYLKMGSYASLGGTDMYACQSELAISKKYLAAGYRIADLEDQSSST